MVAPAKVILREEVLKICVLFNSFCRQNLSKAIFRYRTTSNRGLSLATLIYHNGSHELQG